MKFKIDGSYVNGTDIGHPDGVDIFTACCCGFVAGDTSEKRDANARLVVAAPEMLELLTRVATSTNSGYGSMMSAAALADTLRDLSSQAKQLMAKIDGGGE